MKNRATLIYSLLQACFWSAWAAMFGYASAYLLAAGLSSFRIGIVMGICSLASALVQPLLAGLMDRTQHRYLKPCIILLCLASAGLCIALLVIPQPPAGMLFGLSAGLLQLAAPLVNSLAAENADTDFGVARGVGSLGYAVIFPVIGWLSAWWKPDAAVLSAVLTFIGTAVFVHLFPAAGFVPAEPEKQTAEHTPFLTRYRSFMLVLGGVLFLYISHVFLGNYGYQIVLSKGGDSAAYGTGGSIAALFELPVMFFFARFLQKRPASFWVRICGFSFFLKALIITLASSMTGYYAAMVMQLTGWGMIQVASVYYVNEVIAPADAVRGQSLFTSALALATVIGSFAGGWLIDALSVQALSVTAALLAALGALIVFLCMKPGHRA